MKEKGSVSYLSAILHIYAKLGRKRSRFNPNRSLGLACILDF